MDLLLIVLVALGLILSIGWLLWRGLRALVRYCIARKVQAAIAASALISSSVAFSAYCPQYMEAMVLPHFKLLAEALTGQVMAVDSMLSRLLEKYSERVLSAIAVLTKQKAMAGNQAGESSRLQAQQLANGLKALQASARLKAARVDYGSEYGQGDDPCRTYNLRQTIAGRDADMARELRTRVAAEVYAAPGGYMPAAESRMLLLNAHQPFCTQDQVAAGMCKEVGTLPGADLNAGTLFNPAMGAEKLYDAKSTYINHVVGLTDSPVPKGAGLAASSSAYALGKSSKDAIVSPAIAALKEVQLFTSGVEGGHTGTELPLSMLFQNEIDRYAGDSAEYDKWSKIMAAQAQRGTMIELLKIEALRLAVAGKKLEALEKQEAILAALVALEVRKAGLPAAAQQHAGDAMSNAAIRAIK